MSEWIKESRENFNSLCECIYNSKSATYEEKEYIEKIQKEFEENMEKIEQGHTYAINGTEYRDRVQYEIIVVLSYYNSVNKRENNTKER